MPDHCTAQVVCQGIPVARSPKASGFKVLGAQITFDNRFHVELAKRISKAWRAFAAIASWLRERSASLKLRMALLDACVAQTLFWGACSWNLTRRDCERVRGVQQKMVRSMLRVRPLAGEGVQHYMARTNRLVSDAIARHSLPFDQQYFQRMFKFAGHVARMISYDPRRLTLCIMNYKDWKYISKLQQIHGSQLHYRRLRTWRWERPLIKYMGPDWKDHAQHIPTWMSALSSYLAWRSVNR